MKSLRFGHLLRVLLEVAVLLVIFGLREGRGQSAEKKANWATPVAAAENPFDAFRYFSAVMSGGLIGDTDRQIYRSGKLMRSEFSDQYRVTDIEGPVTWVVFTGDAKGASCARFEVADAGDYPFWGLKDFRVERAAAAGEGEEVIDGHSCKIENLVFVNSKANPEARMEMKIWEAEDLKGFPVKIEAHNVMTNRRFTISYTNVSLQAPEPKLFAHPNKCGRMAGGAEKMKGTGTMPAEPPGARMPQ